MIDLVGYGAATTTFEGTAGPAVAPSTTASIVRAGGGNTDTDNNKADFATAALSSHTPFNSSSPVNPAAPAADTTPPIVSSVALGGATPTPATTLTYTVTFSEAVTGVDASDFSLTSTGSVAGAAVTAVSAVSATTYTVTANAGAGDGTVRLNVLDDDTIKDTAGNALGGAGAGNGAFTTGPSYTVDHTAPTLSSSTPAPGATGVAGAANLTLTFSEAVTAGTGSVVLHDTSGARADVTISITDASQVSFSGSTVTLNPTADLGGSTTYQVRIGAGVVLDAVGNAYGGDLAAPLAFSTANSNPNAPVFTSGATASTPENTPITTPVYTAHATDADPGDTVTYAIAGGADAARFNIDAGTGAVTFKASPDFEAHASAVNTNAYQLSVSASDGAGGHTVTQAVTVNVTDANDNAPVITSAATATAPAGVATTTPVYTATATDADTGPALVYAIAGGDDAARFNIDAASGAVTFKTSPSYSAPDDVGADHTYNIVVQASDGVTAHNAAKAVAISLTNPDSGVLFSANFDSYTATGLSPGGTVAGTLDSNSWKAVGFSDAQPGYGGTVGTGEYGKGTLAASADPSSAGLYSGVIDGGGNHALMIQPTGTDFDTNGYVELRVQNTTGAALTSLSTSFDWVYHNNETRADNLQLAYSTDGVNYTLVPAANLTTPAAATASPAPFTYTHENLTFDPGAVLAPGAYLYLRFEHPSSTGSGSRDEVGVDNVSVAYGAVSHTPILSAANVTQAEANGGTTTFTFSIQRAGDLSAATTVHYATVEGTATAGSDYTAVSGDLTFAPGETSHTVTVQVNGDTVQEPDETFTLSLSNPANASLPTTPITGTITNDDVNILGVADIQGASQTSPFAGSSVTTQGVVTAIKIGSGGGFYIQDSLTTGPAGASHGLFVFTAGPPSGVAVGDAVTVTGLVTEYQAGGDNLSTTELNTPTFTVSSHNNPVTPIVIGAGGVLPPTGSIAPGAPYNPATSGADFYESLEGQIVTIHNAQAVDGTYSGSTWVVADNGAETTGLNARGGITVSATDFNPERIQVYSTALNASMGEHLGDITGVLTYYSSDSAQDPNIGGEYELVPTAPITPPGNSASTAPALPLPTTTLQGDATHVSIGAYNVENLGPVEPGVAQATVDARFALLGKDIAQNLHAPDILGLEEIQDSDGEGTGADLSGSATLNKLIAAIAAAGGPTYQYVQIAPTTTNTNGGAPNGNIRSAYLYNPARVSYVAGSAQLLNDPNLADGDTFNNSRHPLAAQFTFNGQTINAIDVHDYARSGSQELFGANQPPVNSGDQRRVDQTAAVNAYVNQLLAANPNAAVTVQGDFNGFQFEPTLTQLTHAGGGQLNQLSDLLPANERYSTTFEGDAQEIDHLLVSDSLKSGAAFDIVHLNTGQRPRTRAATTTRSSRCFPCPALTPPRPRTSRRCSARARRRRRRRMWRRRRWCTRRTPPMRTATR